MNTVHKLLALLLLLAGCAHAPPADLAITGGMIVTAPGAAPIENGVVLIRDGRIAAVGRVAVPRGTPVVDARGGTVTAGFWNSHAHLFGIAGDVEAALDDLATRHGFTTIVDTGSMLEQTLAIRERIARGEIRGPRILTTGEPIFPKGGTPPMVLELGLRAPEAGEPTDAPQLVARQLERGADAIKLYLVSWMIPSRPAMSREQIAALIAAAHARKKLVLVHPQSGEALEHAVDAGVDILAHTTPEAGPWSDALVAKMIRANVALIPTLRLWRIETRGPRNTEIAVAQLRAFHAAGGRVLFGTDAGYTPDNVPAEEYALMASAGMSFDAILASLTTEPARIFGRGSGTLERGAEADLVVLDGRDFAKVRVVIRGGKVVKGEPPARP
jgi:imidazolonepropionase-like amidohydrolase